MWIHAIQNLLRICFHALSKQIMSYCIQLSGFPKISLLFTGVYTEVLYNEVFVNAIWNQLENWSTLDPTYSCVLHIFEITKTWLCSKTYQTWSWIIQTFTIALLCKSLGKTFSVIWSKNFLQSMKNRAVWAKLMNTERYYWKHIIRHHPLSLWTDACV